MNIVCSKNQIVRAAEALNFPVCDRFSASLWRLISSGYGAGERAQLSRECGYIPFCGFPLSRSGKIAKMTREEVAWELEKNPLCKLEEEVTLVLESNYIYNVFSLDGLSVGQIVAQSPCNQAVVNAMVEYNLNPLLYYWTQVQ